jgi:hypothetical protein
MSRMTSYTPGQSPGRLSNLDEDERSGLIAQPGFGLVSNLSLYDPSASGLGSLVATAGSGGNGSVRPS